MPGQSRVTVPQASPLLSWTVPHEFTIRRRVHFQDTDAAGIIHFANYFRYMEEAETEFLFHLGGLAGVQPGDDFFVAPRVATNAEFLKPVRFGDILDVTIRCVGKGRSSIDYAYSFQLDGVEVAKATLRAVCVAKGADGEYRATPIPEPLDRVLEVAPRN